MLAQICTASMLDVLQIAVLRILGSSSWTATAATPRAAACPQTREPALRGSCPQPRTLPASLGTASLVAGTASNYVNVNRISEFLEDSQQNSGAAPQRRPNGLVPAPSRHSWPPDGASRSFEGPAWHPPLQDRGHGPPSSSHAGYDHRTGEFFTAFGTGIGCNISSLPSVSTVHMDASPALRSNSAGRYPGGSGGAGPVPCLRTKDRVECCLAAVVGSEIVLQATSARPTDVRSVVNRLQGFQVGGMRVPLYVLVTWGTVLPPPGAGPQDIIIIR